MADVWFGDEFAADSGPVSQSTMYGLGGSDNIFATGLGPLLRIYGGDGEDILNISDTVPGKGELYGDAGDDSLFGGVNDDTFYGGAGNDLIVGEEGSDVMEGGAGNDRMFGQVEGVGSNLAGNEKMFGGLGNDRLSGQFGDDFLWGGPGKDKYLFTSSLNKFTNVDEIDDFTPKDDSILVDNAIFTQAGPTGTLAKGKFVIGQNAKDGGDRFIYNKSNGDVFYDRDGTGNAGKVLFVELDKGLNLTHKDFLVI